MSLLLGQILQLEQNSGVSCVASWLITSPTTTFVFTFNVCFWKTSKSTVSIRFCSLRNVVPTASHAERVVLMRNVISSNPQSCMWLSLVMEVKCVLAHGRAAAHTGDWLVCASHYRAKVSTSPVFELLKKSTRRYNRCGRSKPHIPKPTWVRIIHRRGCAAYTYSVT